MVINLIIKMQKTSPPKKKTQNKTNQQFIVFVERNPSIVLNDFHGRSSPRMVVCPQQIKATLCAYQPSPKQ